MKSRKGKVAVNFVRKDYYVVFETDIGKLPQFLLSPGSSHRIMRVGDDYHFRFCRYKFCKGIEVHNPSAFFLGELVIYQLTAMAFDSRKEREIDRGLNNYRFTGAGESKGAKV